MIIAGTVLQGESSPTQVWQYVIAIALVFSLTVLEILGYRRLWPPPAAEE